MHGPKERSWVYLEKHFTQLEAVQIQGESAEVNVGKRGKSPKLFKCGVLFVFLLHDSFACVSLLGVPRL